MYNGCRWCTKDHTCTHHQLVKVIRDHLKANDLGVNEEDLADQIEANFRVEDA